MHDDDGVFRALADPTRRHLLDRLFERDGRTLTELESELEMTRFGVMKHLRVLERAGLIERGRQAQWRPRRLRAEPLRDVATWVDRYRQHWQDSFERLDVVLREIQATQQQQELEIGDDHDHGPDRSR